MNDQAATVKVLIRIPKEAREFLQSRARYNLSTQNAEIVRCLREHMDAAGWKSNQGQSTAEGR